MTEDDNIHPVVKLLAARMESHPDEFWYPETHAELRTGIGTGRWDFALREVRIWANPEELKLLSQGPLDALHRTALDELLNGPERRAEEERLREEERKHFAAQALKAQSQVRNTGTIAPSGQYTGVTQALGQQYAQAQGQNALAGLQMQQSQPSGGGWIKGLLGIK